MPVVGWNAAEDVYNNMKHKYSTSIKDFTVSLACGGGAGAVSKTAVAPLERIKMLLQ